MSGSAGRTPIPLANSNRADAQSNQQYRQTKARRHGHQHAASYGGAPSHPQYQNQHLLSVSEFGSPSRPPVQRASASLDAGGSGYFHGNEVSATSSRGSSHSPEPGYSLDTSTEPILRRGSNVSYSDYVNQLPDPGHEESETRQSVFEDDLYEARSFSLPELAAGIDRQVAPALRKPRDGGEFAYMRYTAVTCAPAAFVRSGYTLRQRLFKQTTQLLIVITMYNEEVELFVRTISGVMENIAHLCRKDAWGADGWQQIVVCIVSDGRQKIKKETLDALATMGVYQAGLAQAKVSGEDVIAHLYEYTTQVSVKDTWSGNPDPKPTAVPCQILFCLKEKNQKKINSHRWAFHAFGPVLKPEICVLLDVGTKPRPESIYRLWKAFRDNENLGGACGQIVVAKGFWKGRMLNPLVASQNFEYKTSNILDKPLESVLGYITVLPGAFSAYRYKAIFAWSETEGPLTKYFMGEDLEQNNNLENVAAGLFNANMYLAEDRILSWELVTKSRERWALRYVHNAFATTDVPDTLAEFIQQRRRWLNGAFFAALYAISHTYQISRSSHTRGRLWLLYGEMLYQTFSLFFTWFGLANYYISFYILMESLNELETAHKLVKDGSVIMHYIYLANIMLCFLLALGNKPGNWLYALPLCVFALLTVYMLIAAVMLSYASIENVIVSNGGHPSFANFTSDPVFRYLVLSIVSTLGLYLFSSLLFIDPWHMVTSLLQYLLFAPSNIHLLGVFAFANVDDTGWGTKGFSQRRDTRQSLGARDGQQVSFMIPRGQDEVEQLYNMAAGRFKRSRDRKKEQKKDKATAPQTDDAKKDKIFEKRKMYRTLVLFTWAASNGLAAVVILYITVGQNNSKITVNSSTGTSSVNPYLVALLICVAALAFIRFIGALAYRFVKK